MQRNVGSTERYLRLATGAVAGVAAAASHGWLRAGLATVAVAGLGTGLAQFCPINRAVGRDTLTANGHSITGAGMRS